MKKVEHYICEICGTEYAEKKSCERCEKEHKKPTGITGVRYNSINNDGSGYPKAIDVLMNNGETITYKRY